MPVSEKPIGRRPTGVDEPIGRRRVAFALLALSAAALPSSAHARRPAGRPVTGLRSVSYAQPPPDFAFDEGLGPERLKALRGKPVVINFWASYCPPCRDELDALTKLRSAYGDGVALLTITDEAPGNARTFLRARGMNLPVIEDPERKIFSAYGITPIPVTIVTRPDGTVSFVSNGEVTWDELHAAVAATLAAPSPSPSPSPSASP